MKQDNMSKESMYVIVTDYSLEISLGDDGRFCALGQFRGLRRHG